MLVFIKRLVITIYVLLFKTYPRFIKYESDNINKFSDFTIKSNLIHKHVLHLNDIIDYDYIKTHSSKLVYFARAMDKAADIYKYGYFRVTLSKEKILSFKYFKCLNIYDIEKSKLINEKKENTIIFYVKIKSRGYHNFIEFLRKFAIYTWKSEVSYNENSLKDFGINPMEDRIYVSSNSAKFKISTNDFKNMVTNAKIDPTKNKYFAVYKSYDEFRLNPIVNIDDIDNFKEIFDGVIIFTRKQFIDHIQSLYDIMSPYMVI